MIDDLLDARDDLEQLLDEALPALEARPRAEAAEVLAVLLVAPLRRTGPSERLRRLVVRRLQARGTPAAAAVLEAIAELADEDTARRAAAAVEQLPPGGVDGIGAIAFEEGRRVEVDPPFEGLAATMRRPGEPGARLLKLWLDPEVGMLAGGWTDPLDEKRLERERERFARAAGGELGPAVDPAREVDRIVRRAADLRLPLAEGVALVIAQLRRAAGSPDWPAFDVVVEGSARPGRGRPGRVSVRRPPR